MLIPLLNRDVYCEVDPVEYISHSKRFLDWIKDSDTLEVWVGRFHIVLSTPPPTD